MLIVLLLPWCCKWSLYYFPYCIHFLKKFSTMNMCHFCNKEDTQRFLWRLFSKGAPQIPLRQPPPPVLIKWFFYGPYRGRPADPGKNDDAPGWFTPPNPPSPVTHTYLGFKSSSDSISFSGKPFPRMKFTRQKYPRNAHRYCDKHIKL